MPTLLDMYDALYARLSEDPQTNNSSEVSKQSDPGGSESMPSKDSEKRTLYIEEKGSACGIGTGNSNDNEFACNQFRTTGDLRNNNSFEKIVNDNTCDSSISECGDSTSSPSCSSSNVVVSVYDNVITTNDDSNNYPMLRAPRERRHRKEHIYAEPVFVNPNRSINTGDDASMPSCSASSASSISSLCHSPAISTSSSSSPSTGSGPDTFNRKFALTSSYRPLSSISSSSSSSSNSLPRRQVEVVGASCYLASAESLEENDADNSDTEETTRRRGDRSIKSRREKALRNGK